MRKFGEAENVLVIPGYGSAMIVARALKIYLRETELDTDLQEMDRDTVLEVERDIREQLLLPQRHGGAE